MSDEVSRARRERELRYRRSLGEDTSKLPLRATIRQALSVYGSKDSSSYVPGVSILQTMSFATTERHGLNSPGTGRSSKSRWISPGFMQRTLKPGKPVRLTGDSKSRCRSFPRKYVSFFSGALPSSGRKRCCISQRLYSSSSFLKPSLPLRPALSTKTTGLVSARES